MNRGYGPSLQLLLLATIILLATGKTQRDIAETCECSVSTVARIAREYASDVQLVKTRTNAVAKGLATRGLLTYHVILGDTLDDFLKGKIKRTAQNVKTLGSAVESVYRVSHLLSLQSEAQDPRMQSQHTVTERQVTSAQAKLKVLKSDRAGMAPATTARAKGNSK